MTDSLTSNSVLECSLQLRKAHDSLVHDLDAIHSWHAQAMLAAIDKLDRIAQPALESIANPDAPPSSINKRGEFEAYILRNRGTAYLERNDPGIDAEHDYADLFVQEAWEAWQAAKTLSASPQRATPDTAAASSNPSATDNVAALRFLARWYEPSKGFPGANHGQIVNALNESAAELEDLRDALTELHAQVDQAREGFGLYRDSPSMNGAMARAEAALRPPPKLPAPNVVARYKSKGDDIYATVDRTDPNALERYSLTAQEAGGDTLAQERSEWRAFLKAADTPDCDDEVGPSP